MRLQNRFSLENLRNRTEEMVFEKIEKLKEEGTVFCTCQECVLDLAAFALNHVTPRYYTSLLGPLRPNRTQEKRLQIEIDLALETGLKRIRSHPHNEDVSVS
ncbi:MAG TPA: hypothetical protein ENI15_14410 [Spirochaetes bacterium]|nr:hypothetical protein [Spirochaetota bacterium]